MATNTIYINGIAKNYTISSQPGYNMYGFFNYTNRTTHNIQAATYTPANFNKYTQTARDWDNAFSGRNDLASIPSYNMINAINMSNAFDGCTKITSAPTIPANVTNMSCTFRDCTKITSAPTIPANVTNMSSTFDGCTNLTSAPTIPAKVTDMDDTFRNCTKITSAPTIPAKVISMSSTFRDCTKITSAPTIPANVTCMRYAFYGCTNLTSAPNIPAKVTDMIHIFEYCSNLKGTFYILSNNINDAQDCFYYHNKAYMLNVYIHAGTTTYNAFNAYLGGKDNATLNVHIKTF